MAYLHNTLESQLPQHVLRDYPLFVEFLKAYYEWLGQKGQPYFGLENHLDWMNFKDSIDDYVSFLRKEYLFNLPANTADGLEIFLKNSKQFHLSVGTEDSFKFIFKILFGAEAGDVELYFPRKDILRVSDSSWTAAQSLMYITDSGHSSEFLYRILKQTREVYPGVFRYAYAIVERVSDRYAGKFKITELYLRDIQGEFLLDWPVTIEASTSITEWIIPTGNRVEITNPGQDYYLDDKVTVGGSNTFNKVIVATEVGVIDTQISSLLTDSELIVKIDGIQVSNFDYDGRNLEHPSIVVGSVIQITFPTFDGYSVIDKVGTNGEILSITVLDSIIGVNSSQPITIYGLSEEIEETANTFTIDVEGIAGNGFEGQVVPSILRSIQGYFVDDRGHLDSTKVIQDSNYYQDFSYVIRSSLDVDKYKDIVLKLLHPAGMKMFGKVDILEIIKLFVLDIYDEISILEKSIITDYVRIGLYTSYEDIDRHKLKYPASVWKTRYFKDMRVGDIIEDKRNEPFNIQDVEIDITTPYDSVLETSKTIYQFANFTLPANIQGYN